MSEQNPKTRKESMQKLYATALSCKHEFQVSYFRYTVIARAVAMSLKVVRPLQAI